MKTFKISLTTFLLSLFLCFFISSPSSNAQVKWKISDSGTSDWRDAPLGSGFPSEYFRYIDMNGDGYTDILCLYNNAWRYSKSGKTAWTTFNNSSPLLSIDPNEIKFGDFNGDGRPDFFFVWEGNFCYASGYTMTQGQRAEPIILRPAFAKVSEVGLGDFDGDGITDIFKPGNPHWKYSPKGIGDWVELQPGSGYPFEYFRLRDFDGDGITDVFCAKGDSWLFSKSGNIPWIGMNDSTPYRNIKADKLRFGDFNGDGKLDIMMIWEGDIIYFTGKRYRQKHVLQSLLAQIGLGNFIGDKKTDLFHINE